MLKCLSANAFDLLDQVTRRTFETGVCDGYIQYALDALKHHAAYYFNETDQLSMNNKGVAYVKEIRQKENALEDKILKRTKSVEGKITCLSKMDFKY